MTTKEHDMKQGENTIPTWDQIEAAIYQAAGVGSGAVMRLAPNVVMPEADIIPGCKKILAELKAGKRL